MFRAPLWLLAALPALGAAAGLSAWAAARRRRVAAALGGGRALARSAEDAAARRRAAAGLRLGALALIFLALSGPRWGVELVETRADGRAVVVAVDVSLSMRTPDVKPTRLERAKAALGLLLDQLAGERVGVVAFAGDAHVVCPLTADVEAAKQLLSALDVGAVPTPGTAIGSAIRTATAMLGRGSGDKSLVLLTDGEDHRSDPLGAAAEAASAGVRVFAVGIGTPEGEPIPAEGGGYKKDARGAAVISRLGEAALAEIARRTGGAYDRTTPGQDEIAVLAARIQAGAGAPARAGAAARRRDRYAWPLALAALLMLAELALPLLPRPGAAGGAILTVALLAAAPGRARAAGAEGALRRGNALYEKGRHEEALARYAEAAAKSPADPRPVFNAGDALSRLDRPAQAAGAFDAVGGRADLPADLRAAALYNLGNARYRAGDYAGAAEAYRRSLVLAPRDADARHSLAVALLRRRRPPPQKKPEPPKSSPKPKDGPGGAPQPQRPQPREGLSREDAERVLRAVAEREKAARRQAGAAATGRKAAPSPASGEDW